MVAIPPVHPAEGLGKIAGSDRKVLDFPHSTGIRLSYVDLRRSSWEDLCLRMSNTLTVDRGG